MIYPRESSDQNDVKYDILFDVDIVKMCLSVDPVRLFLSLSSSPEFEFR